MSRYFRLMALSALEMACCVPLSIFLLICDLQLDVLEPWVSWEYSRREFMIVESTSFEVLREYPDMKAVMELNRWLLPSCAFAFFLFFGLSSEATEEYKRLLWRFTSLLGFKPSPPKSQTSSTGTLDSANTQSDQSSFGQHSICKPDVHDIESQTQNEVPPVVVVDLESNGGRVKSPQTEVSV
ncbi:a-factor receptor [Ceratobasidium sp. 392]|nr:a-factor receptor [Ceratobasidium sp. 392]